MDAGRNGRIRERVGGRPRLTGTKWDALIAATVEHVCELHGSDPPAWTNEAERFNDPPEGFLGQPGELADAATSTPGAFMRHGALFSPLDIDYRGGEHAEWIVR